jgi:RHS repeat-associated protein
MSVEAFDFRTLMAARLRDPNDNLSETITDELGRVKAMAIMGKGAEADDLVGQQPTTAAAEVTAITQFLDAATSDQLITRGKNLLVRASMRFAYDYDAFMASGKPARTASILREEHFQDNNDSDIQIGFEYYGGLGEVVMKKGQAEPGVAKQVTVQPDNSITVSDIDTMQGLRWLGTGRKVINNKGNPVKKYQPYFSTTHQYEDQKELVESGVTPLIFYDAIGRETEMLLPDGTFTRKTYTAWERTFYDPGDTVMDSSWHDQRVNMLINAELAADGKDPLKEAAAATLSETYHDTPSIVYLDPMGRPVLQRGHNIVNSVDVFKFERVEIDIEGSVLSTVDARGNVAAAYKYSMLGVNAYQYLLDSGQRWDLEDVAGKALRAWDERDHEFRHEYDVLGRPSQSRVLGGDGVQPLNHVYERIFYGEAEAAAEANNLKGKVVRFYDTAGLSAVDEYDIKGEPLVNRRRLFADYKSVPNWTDANLAVTLEAEEYASSTVRDALGRSTEIVGPDGAVEQITYNEAGLLQSKQFQHVAGPLETIVVNIDYNEKGQRLRIERGNGVTTRYAYDKQNFNIIRVVSETAGNQVVQDLRYTYDAVGNVTHIDDAAVPLQFFNNQVITGVSTFSYDAFYQLTQATGRENNVVFSFGSRDNWNDQLYAHALNNGDPAATRNYTQSYSYDLAGNLLEMGHQAANNNWARGYTYNANSNRLVATSAGAQNFNYGYHSTHGFITSMPHLQDIGWNFKEKLIRSVRQKVLSGTPETTYYQYSADGERIRKITELAAAAGQSPLRKEERIYVGNYERYLKHSGANTGLVRHSHSIVDEEGRVALLEVRNNVDDGTNPRLTRYQLSNHLGSVSLELDQNAQTISYEEYHPFGTSAYRVSNAAIKAAAKRYRYLGLERDEETGLSYHSARYYITWLGRWLSTDPSGQNEGLNLYWYARNNPSSLRDVNGNESDEQKASGILQDFLIEQDVNYRKEVKFKVEVDGNWVEGRADFFIETKDGWQPLEMKGKANSKWTEAQKKYLPALKKGAKWETTGTSKFPKKVSGSGSAGVLNVHTVAAGKQQFRRLYESTIIKRPQGDPSKGEKITITRDSNGDIVDRTVEPDKVGRERAKAKGKKPKVKAPKGKAPRVKAKGPWGLIIGAVVGVTILVTTGDAYAAVQSVNPAAETTDAVVEGGDAGDVGGGVAKDIFYWTPPGWIYGTGELLWDANQAAMDASHFPVPEGFTEQMVKEGRNPFCAVCHDPRGPGSEAYRQQQLMESTFQGMPSMLDNADTQRAIVDWIESAQ